MRRFFTLLSGVVMLLTPLLACGPGLASHVTPTPTKTPKRVFALEQTPAPVITPTLAVTNTPTLSPPTDTPTLEPSPTETPAPVPTDTPLPTNTPVPPPPPPTNTPPPLPTNTPAPPPPTQPPPNPLTVSVELPDGNTFDIDEQVHFVFVVRDPGGVKEFSWGVFTQNQTSLMGDTHECGGVTECRLEIKEDAPPFKGTFIVGADALSVSGKTTRGVGEIYIQ